MNNAPHRLIFVLQATTTAVAALLHSSLWFPGEPPTRLKSRKSFARETMNLLTMAYMTIMYYEYFHFVTVLL